MISRYLQLALAFATASSLSACLVDLDEPCGDDLILKDGACVCPKNMVAEDGQCVSCGKHAEVRGGACECEAGYERSSGKCVEAATRGDSGVPDSDEVNDGAGDAAACAEGECEGSGEPELPTCASSEDCADEELCDLYGTEQCQGKPEGLGQSCEADADCAGTQATYCEIFSSNTCQVQGCAEAAGVCPGDMACCDFAVLARSLCIPADRLEMGACPAPGELVEREQP